MTSKLMPGFHWTFSLSALEHGAFVFAGLLLYVLVTRIGNQRRHPSAAIAWVLTIAVIRYLGIPLFLLFGTRKFARPKRMAHVRFASEDDQAVPAWVNRLLVVLAVPPPTRNQSVSFHEDGPNSLLGGATLSRGWCARSGFSFERYLSLYAELALTRI